jgi:hypothetical protein
VDEAMERVRPFDQQKLTPLAIDFIQFREYQQVLGF